MSRRRKRARSPASCGRILRLTRSPPTRSSASPASAELEPHRAGDTIFAEGADAVQHLRVIRSRRGRARRPTAGCSTCSGEGELFGQASLLSGLPPGFGARATENTLCYRIPADEARAAASAPEGVRFVARSLLEQPTELHVLAREPARNPADQPVGSLVRGEPAVCGPDTTIREAAPAA